MLKCAIWMKPSLLKLLLSGFQSKCYQTWFTVKLCLTCCWQLLQICSHKTQSIKNASDFFRLDNIRIQTVVERSCRQLSWYEMCCHWFRSDLQVQTRCSCRLCPETRHPGLPASYSATGWAAQLKTWNNDAHQVLHYTHMYRFTQVTLVGF